MELHELTPARGSKKARKVIGRGEGSGHGGSATRGTKGQGSRVGLESIGFEGGQMSLVRRIPKRGFSHTRFRTVYAVVNVGDLSEVFDGQSDITPALMAEKGLVRKGKPVKLLGNGEITKSLKITCAAVSGPAKEKVTKAGGTVESVKYQVSSVKKSQKQ